MGPACCYCGYPVLPEAYVGWHDDHLQIFREAHAKCFFDNGNK